MSLNSAHEILGWPSRDEVLKPKGVAASVFVQLLERKLGNSISRLQDGYGVRVGVLASDPNATEAPLAIVCDFPGKVSEQTLRETQKLAWNLGRSRLLITVEPHIIRKWTCYEPPVESHESALFDSPEIEPPIELDPETGRILSQRSTMSLHWLELLTGEFFRRNESRFKPEKRAEQMLLSNLVDVRHKLIDAELSDDICHDLLARIIFIQFLFDRKDTDGKAALDETELLRLYREEGILSGVFRNLGEILESYEDTYALFRWLNNRFNGDLFPGKGTDEEQAVAWEAERLHVRPDHLSLLSRFVCGNERMADGQLSFWPYYALDAVPLELISTIYEEFVKKDAGVGVHYTPSHVADLMLDSALPWDGCEWKLKVLDPACGSGVFLVKAFQRLIYRWKAAYPDKRISGTDLAGLLDGYIFGIDKDPHAVRVASFSLYLAMCDEIDPRDYWKEVHFPPLRGRRLICADFFDEIQQGFRTSDEPEYDVIVGNPPWGKNTASDLARTWQGKSNWPISNGDIGPLFMAKALNLANPGGCLALLQPAGTLLFNHMSPAKAIRRKLFGLVQVQEIVNLSALRHVLFRKAIVSACVLIVRNSPPDGSPFWYSCPKLHHSQEDRFRIIIDEQDVHHIFPYEVEETPWIWSALLWGGRRDVSFIRRIGDQPNIEKLEAQGVLHVRQGITRSLSQRFEPAIVNRRVLEAEHFPRGDELSINALDVDVTQNPYVHDADSTDFSAFAWPQLIVKQSFMKKQGRFRAAIVRSDEETGGIVCTDSYLTLHSAPVDSSYLDAACLAFNSKVAVYYLLLTSGRFAMDRNEPQAEAFRKTPLPYPKPNILDGVNTLDQLDERVAKVYNFNQADRLLIEDLVSTTLPDYKGGKTSPGRRATRRRTADGMDEPDLTMYCDHFESVLRSAYGADKNVGAVVLSEPRSSDPLPVRTVSFYLNLPGVNNTRVEPMASEELRERLTILYKEVLSADHEAHRFYQRCLRCYDTVSTPSGVNAICVNLVKPDQMRYWTRSMALRDADNVALDMAIWSGSSDNDRDGHGAAAVA